MTRKEWLWTCIPTLDPRHGLAVMKSLRRTLIGGAALVLAACGESDPKTSEADLTNVPVSARRNQRETGNCWLFATANWVESLELGANQTSVKGHFSVAYWDYWDWFAKITGETLTEKTDKDLRGELDSGGSWGEAVEIIAARGLVRARDFVGSGEVDEADAINRALTHMSKSLREGELRTPSARRDPVRVRAELDRAFDLSPRVVDAMAASFGPEGRATFKDGRAVAHAPVLAPADLPVRCPRPNGSPETRPLSDAIGKRVGGQDADVRNGEYAWTRVRFDAKSSDKRREFFLRIQRVLKQGAAIPVAWYWASNGDPGKIGEFRRTPTTPAVEVDSTFHETIIYDYEITDVPGFGTLRAGRSASDAQESAALSKSANITFFRVLDSYYDIERTKRRGFSDMYIEYLVNELEVCPDGDGRSRQCERILPLDEVTLPRGF
jgi:hypothetical protein